MYTCLKKATYQSDELQFQSISQKDMEPIRLWRNEQIDILRQKEPIPSEMQEQYFKQEILPSFSQQHPKQILLAIHHNNILIGYTALVHIDWEKRYTEMSFLLDTKIEEDSPLFRKAYFAAVQLLKKIAFEELSFTTLSAMVYIFRTKMIQLLQEAGFHETERLKEYAFKKGKKWDAFIYESTRADWNV